MPGPEWSVEEFAAEFNAAVQAIEALRTYEWSVTSLQEHSAALAESQNRASQERVAQEANAGA